jgi:hypothetical protein
MSNLFANAPSGFQRFPFGFDSVPGESNQECFGSKKNFFSNALR